MIHKNQTDWEGSTKHIAMFLWVWEERCLLFFFRNIKTKYLWYKNPYMTINE